MREVRNAHLTSDMRAVSTGHGDVVMEWDKLLDGDRFEWRLHLEDEFRSQTGLFERTETMATLQAGTPLFIGDTVRTSDGKIGTVVSQCFLFPEDGVEGCLVNVPSIGSIAYNTADLEVVTVESVWAELQSVPAYVERTQE